MLVSALAAPLVLAGCGATYQIDDSMRGTTIEIVEGQRYRTYFYQGLPGCARLAGLPAEYEPYSASARPLPMRPGREFMFTMERVRTNNDVIFSVCRPHVAFVPEAGGRYRARFLERPRGCAVAVTRLEHVGDRVVEHVERTARPVSLDEPPSPACSPEQIDSAESLRQIWPVGDPGLTPSHAL